MEGGVEGNKAEGGSKLNYYVLIFLRVEGEGFGRVWRGSNYF